MKKLLVFTLFVIAQSYGIAQNTDYYDRIEHIFGNIDKTKVTTGFLKEFGIRFNEVEVYNGVINSNNLVDKTQWQSLYSSLYTMRVGNAQVSMTAPNVVFGHLKAQQANTTEDVLLAAQHYNYQQYNTNAVSNGDITVSNDQIFDVAGRNPYDTKTLFGVTPLKNHLQGDTFTFKLPSNLIYTNTGLTISQVQIDFSDGSGYQTVAINAVKTISYTTSGEKEIKVKFVYSSGPTLYSHSKIWVDYISSSPGTQARFNGFGTDVIFDEEPIVGDPWQGSSATGFVTVELAPGHTELTKPLIVIEGFDPDNSFDYDDLINENDPGGLLIEIDLPSGLTLNQAIENEGYDLVFINYANGTDYIQRNAYMVAAVIDWVNDQKVGNEKNVVLGMSMGGLVARYALRHMEMGLETHDTKLYISHDAPHQGANIPLAFQAIVRHLAGEEISVPIFLSLFSADVMPLTDILPNQEELENAMNLLQSPAARQMLIYQLQGTGDNISIDTSTLYHSFATEYSNMGYPQQGGIRNIAIANGSECGKPLDFSPYATLANIDYTEDNVPFLNLLSIIMNIVNLDPIGVFLSLLSTDSDVVGRFNLKALPNQEVKRIYKGEVFIKKTILFFIQIHEPLIDEDSLYTDSAMLPLDNTNGGVYNIDTFVSLPAEFDDYVFEREFNFIPTFSSLDIGSGNQSMTYTDLSKAYSPLSPPLAPKNIPFHNFYTNPSSSESHVQFTLENGNWLMDELSGNTAFYSCISDCPTAKLPLKITGGSDQICDNASQTYQLSNLNPDADATIVWSVFPPGAVSNIAANGNNVTITSSGNLNGVATLKASIATDCGNKISERNIYMGAQRPRLLNLYGEEVFHIEACTTVHYNFVMETPPGALEWEWRKISGNYSLLNVSNDHATIYSHFPAYGIFDVRVRDACGWSPRTMITVNVSNCSGGFEPQFVVHPNPATDVLYITDTAAPYGQAASQTTIESGSEPPSSATLFDFNGNPVHTMTPAVGSMGLQSFPSGHYILVVSQGSSTESHHILIE